MNMIKEMMRGLIITAIFLVVGGCSKEEEVSGDKSAPPPPAQKIPEQKGYRAVPVEGGGSISGRVSYHGKWTSVVVPVAKDTTVCGGNKEDPSLIVDPQGGVRFTVAHLTDIREGKAAAGVAPVLDQKGCEYFPHVLAFPAGTTVEILNGDGVLHNVHSFSERNKAFNKAQPKYLKKFTHTFTEVEIVSVKCDVHSWMSAWLFVTDHPYYDVTSERGSFEIKEIPPGEYSLEVWHERLGKLTKRVKVASGEETEVNFDFAGPSN